MNMKAMLGAVLALVLAIGVLVLLISRSFQQELQPPAPVPAEIADQIQANPFELQAPGPYPKVVVEETHFEFGVMALGGEQSHDFVFKNEGEGPLRLAKGPMMCKCTMPTVPDQEIKPGESIKISLTWKPVEASEDFSKEAVIWTNDPLKPKVILSIEGKVFADPVLLPSEFAVGDIPWDKERTSELLMYSPTAKDLKVESAEVSDPQSFSVTWDQVNQQILDIPRGPGSTALSAVLIKLKVLPNGSVGPFSGWVKLKINRGEGEQKLEVRGARSGSILIHGKDYQASLTMLDLKRFKSADGQQSRMFLFLEPFEQELQITEVVSKSKFLAATLTKESAPGAVKDRYVLLVQANKGVVPGTLFTAENPDELTIKTNHPVVKELVLKVRYIVQ